jgi:hypothetical protein
MTMSKALYFPHTDVQSPVILKKALLLWDNLETIVPHRKPTNRPDDVLLREAVDLVVTHRVPTDGERQEAHSILDELARTGVLTTLIQQSPSNWRHHEYLVYPDKFLHETWNMLKQVGMARWIKSESDYSVPAAVGLLMMSILADVCAGTQIQKVTDRTEAYAWVAKHHARVLGSQYVTGLDASQVAPGHDRLVALSLEVIDGRAVPLKKLVEFRRREARQSGSGYSAMRRRYLKTLQDHLSRIGRDARSVSDVQELDRQFKEDLRQDLAELKTELGLANLKTLLSKEVALSALILAGSLMTPVAGLTALATQVGGIGIIPLLKAAVDLRAARRDTLKKHSMSWLFLANQGRLTLR